MTGRTGGCEKFGTSLWYKFGNELSGSLHDNFYSLAKVTLTNFDNTFCYVHLDR